MVLATALHWSTRLLKTLESMGPLHGYGIARRIEQTSGGLLSVNYGTLYPALLKLEQEGYIESEWGVSDNNRQAKYYQLTRAGRKQVQKSLFPMFVLAEIQLKSESYWIPKGG